MSAAIADKKHVPVLESALQWARAAVADNDSMIRDIVHDRAWKIVRWTGLDETVADKLIQALEKLLDDVASNPDHPLRKRGRRGTREPCLGPAIR